MRLNAKTLPGAIIAFEAGELADERAIDLHAYLVRTGLAWKLQGSYGRAAELCIKYGFIDRRGKVLRYPGQEEEE